ncbi:MAG: sigma-70 family RNA polymerase sigma factor [Muribaculaceae bacterium]|nr:sigma-70 family RNA polymerase sigma factor [Muribaculaceae bacterium]
MESREFTLIAPGLRERIVSMVKRFAPAEGPADISDDVAQDTLLRLWSMKEKLDEYRSVEALAMTVARNLALDALRSARPHQGLEDLALADRGPAPDEVMALKETSIRLDAIISALPSLQQAVLRMRHEDGMEIDEIALALGSTPGNIRTALSRARHNVKNLFKNGL